MRVRSILLILPILSLLGGCAPAKPRPAPVRGPQVSLLFDRHPGYPAASDILHAGRWPSTVSRFPEPEVIYYRETVYDVQGPSRWQPDHTYRRFELHREGRATR